MSESANANPFGGDLLASLAANPDLLKNAMQMASALASSGMLSGLFGSAPSGESSTPSSPPPNRGDGSAGGSFADLLAGLMGQSGTAGSAEKEGVAVSAKPSEDKKTDGGKSQQQEVEQKRPPSPSHNDRIHLLQSICPFLPDDKREKVQFLIKLLSLLSAAEQMGIGSGKLF